MSEQQNVLNALTFSFSVQALDGEILTQPVYRLVIDVSYGYSVGRLQKGYYIRFNDNNYFLSSSIDVETIDKAEKVFTFLHKSQVPFTISVRRSETLSGHQNVRLNNVVSDTQLYTLKSFKVYKGLWREIEGVLYETKNSEIARFSGVKLDWVLELIPQEKLSFTQPSNISASLCATQGHLQVFKLPQLYTLPSYLYLPRKRLTFFNHEVKGDMYVIPLGPEMRIVHLRQEAQVTSSDHDPVLLDVGEYLLIHPRPRDAVD